MPDLAATIILFDVASFEAVVVFGAASFEFGIIFRIVYSTSVFKAIDDDFRAFILETTGKKSDSPSSDATNGVAEMGHDAARDRQDETT